MAIKYTQLKLKPEYRDKLKRLADSQCRSMAGQLEYLIDVELYWLDQVEDQRRRARIAKE